jgi:hypothetical protein
MCKWQLVGVNWIDCGVGMLLCLQMSLSSQLWFHFSQHSKTKHEIKNIAGIIMIIQLIINIKIVIHMSTLNESSTNIYLTNKEKCSTLD